MHAISDYSASVRDYAVRNYVNPARQSGMETIKIRAGDVRRALNLGNRVPTVCQALRSKKFLNENNLELVKVEGPPSGQSTTATFTYRLREKAEASSQRRKEREAFLRLRGIAKDIFASLGGGEAFIRNERAHFYGDERDDVHGEGE